MMKFMVTQYPEMGEDEIKAVAHFKRNTIQLYLQNMDARTSWQTLITYVNSQYINIAIPGFTLFNRHLFGSVNKYCCNYRALKILVETNDDRLQVIQVHGLSMLHEVCMPLLYFIYQLF